jgi:hypothetical protein
VVVWEKYTDVSEMLTAFIIKAIIFLMMEAASTSETSVNFYQTTRRNNPEDSHLHNFRRENLKYHLSFSSFSFTFSTFLFFFSFHFSVCFSVNRTL